MHATIVYQTKRGASVGKPCSLDCLEAELTKLANRRQKARVDLNGVEIGEVTFTDCGADGVLWYYYLEPTP